ncbi:MAG: hypothetical protein J1F40_10470 [Prevotellaceae bacterium]|nr:hypothetical protein [Prevotellaceae bacterium]
MNKMILNEDGSINFNKFNLLTEAEQVSCMVNWTQNQKMEYLMQDTISEKECFTPIFNLIDQIEEGKVKNGGSL